MEQTSFCKIIFQGQPTYPLRIPPEFVKHMSSEASRGVTLKGLSGNYQVKILKKEGDMYLGHGWDQFARDNSLGNNEFLIFNYNGATRFDVQIFDPNRCERIKIWSTNQEFTSRPRNKHDDQEPRLKKKESQIKEEEEMDPAPTKKKGRHKKTDSPLPVPVPFTSDLPYFWMQMGVNQSCSTL